MTAINGSDRRRFAALLVGTAACLSLAPRGYAQDASATQSLQAQNQQLANEVRNLEARVNDLETRQDQLQTSREAADAVSKDASLRSQVLPLSGMSAGFAPSAGFVIRSQDGAFSLHPGLVLDARYMTSYRDHLPAGGSGEFMGHGGSDTQSGFDITRLRLTFDGTLYNNIGYFLQFQDDQGSAFGLLDAFITYHFADSPFTFKAGQFKDPLYHERNISEAKLLAVDRSYDEALIGGGQTSRVQGVALLYDHDRTRGQLAIHDGFDSLNTKFIDAGGIGTANTGGAGVTPTDFGVSGRIEYLAIGNRTHDLNPFSQYDQFTALHAKQDILILGGGFDYSQAGSNGILFHTVDAQYDNTNGLGLYAAYLGSYRDLNTNQGVTPGDYYDPGFVVQGSYIFAQKIEPFARFDFTHLDPGSVTGLKVHDVDEFTVGANYYLYGQNVKFTLDGSWLPDGAPADSDALGILKDSGHNEFVLRGQFQLAI